ncbi:hypothetical protein KAH81_01530 [bacterium]|nr:hypothetical protein [bacterium]
MMIDENTTLEAILKTNSSAMKIVARHGLHALSCPSEIYCSLKSISETRGIPLEHLLIDLRQILE